MRRRSITWFACGFAQACAVAALGPAGYNSALSRLKGTRGILASGSEETREEGREGREEARQAGVEDGEEACGEEACGEEACGEGCPGQEGGQARREGCRQAGSQARRCAQTPGGLAPTILCDPFMRVD